MGLEYEAENGTLLWIKNPFSGVVSYITDLKRKNFSFTLGGRTGLNQTDLAPERSSSEAFQEAVAKCPFCPGNEHHSPSEVARVPRASAHDEGADGLHSSWTLRAIHNLFPRVPERFTGGRNESYIIIEDPRHFRDHPRSTDDLVYTGMLDGERFLDILLMASQLTDRALSNPTVGSVIIRKNQGPESGASQPHVHSQVIGVPGLAPALDAETRATRNEPDLWQELLRLVEALGLVVAANEKIVSYVSPIGVFPRCYEVVMPNHFGPMSKLAPEDLRLFARALHALLRTLGPLPLDYEIHQGPEIPLHAHLNSRLFPYSNVGGTLVLPAALPEIASQLRARIGEELARTGKGRESSPIEGESKG